MDALFAHKKVWESMFPARPHLASLGKGGNFFFSRWSSEGGDLNTIFAGPFAPHMTSLHLGLQVPGRQKPDFCWHWCSPLGCKDSRWLPSLEILFFTRVLRGHTNLVLLGTLWWVIMGSASKPRSSQWRESSQRRKVHLRRQGWWDSHPCSYHSCPTPLQCAFCAPATVQNVDRLIPALRKLGALML